MIKFTKNNVHLCLESNIQNRFTRLWYFVPDTNIENFYYWFFSLDYHCLLLSQPKAKPKNEKENEWLKLSKTLPKNKLIPFKNTKRKTIDWMGTSVRFKLLFEHIIRIQNPILRLNKMKRSIRIFSNYVETYLIHNRI